MPIKPVSELVAEATAAIETMPLDKARAALDAGEVLFVDIREKRELERDGKIPGAVHVPRGMLEFWIDPASPYHKPWLDTGRKLALYCGSAWRSALAAKSLRDMGIENVCQVEGGFSAWREAGHPLETQTDPQASGSASDATRRG